MSQVQSPGLADLEKELGCSVGVMSYSIPEAFHIPLYSLPLACDDLLI